jgi:hypothetical protein
MRRPQGQATIFSPDGIIERDTFTCHHCQKVVTVKPLQDPSAIEYGGTCKGCMRFICAPCVGAMTTLGKCIPFEKRLEAYERGRAFAEAVGVVLR